MNVRALFKERIKVVERVVAYLHQSADNEGDSLQAEALRFAAGELENEMNIDDGDLRFLPKVKK